MVSLNEVVASNNQIATSLPPHLVVVFAGATTGIGYYTIKKFVQYAIEPRIYFMARSPDSARRVIGECQAINPKAEMHLIKVDLSSVKETDKACDEIKSREKTINILINSAGELILDWKLTDEGLNNFLTTIYYTRIRVAQNLLPLLEEAAKTSPIARFLNVAGGTKEGEIDVNDLPSLKIPMSRIRGHLTSMTTFAMESLADQAPTVSFVHDFPGSVPSPLGHETPGVLGYVYRLYTWILKVPLHRWICVPIDESGERHVYLATSARYPPKKGKS
ncbi:NAD(P)-binding protein, partial [Periconia macrospinosa]